MTYQQYFKDIDLNKIDEIIDFFENRKLAVSEKIISLSKAMTNMRELSSSQGEFYAYRQNLTAEKFNCMKLSSSLLKQLKQLKKDLLKAYKFGDKTSLSKDTQIALKNNDEREIFFEADLKEYEYRIKTVDNHISFIVDSIENLKNMIYGMETAIKLQDYNTSI
mgnify:CR=1 FL=1